MKWSVRSVYFYLVSLIMLITLVFGIANFINNVIDMFDPSARAYIDKPSQEIMVRERLRTQYPNATEDEIARWAQEEVEKQYEDQVRQNLYWRWRRLIQSAVLIVIAYPIYRYHWRGARALDS